ncbi:hypothetical protein [Luteimonas huabeiensis]|uniref:hypothetical protein n=1 Tax=Luteimonas huabeiensis TaxID=1244513 RepID=UPI001267C6FF|nr:hypothetical protein [Luteimonas huabeiensis]
MPPPSSPAIARAMEAVERALAQLEAEMPDLQHLHRDLFSYANAWAERHDAVLDLAPPSARADVEARLRRIGIRWGLADGVRSTGQFPALDPPQRPRQAAQAASYGRSIASSSTSNSSDAPGGMTPPAPRSP